MEQASPARLYATLVGAALVLAGIVGFFYSSSFGSPGEVDEVLGIFAVNGWENVLHIATGVLCLLLAGFAARWCALWLGALYVAIGVWGFLLGSGGEILGLLPVDSGDNLLHLILGALGLAAAASTPSRRARAPAAASKAQPAA
jgi:Domain of unknown function (DUF4383)